MKMIRLLCSLSVVFVMAVILPQRGFSEPLKPDPDLLGNAEVRLPYGELKKLWEAARKGTEAEAKAKEAETPPDGALLAAHFTANLCTDALTLEAEFKAENFGGAWEKVKLMDANRAVASVDPPDARVVVDGKDLCLLAKGPGAVTVKLRFVPQPLPSSSEESFLRFTSAPSAVALLEVHGLPEGRGLKVEDGPVLPGREGVATLPLSAKGGEVSLTLAELAREPKPEPPPPPPQPSERSLQNEALVFEGEGELAYRVQAHVLALNGSALEATLLLPMNARGVKVEGGDLKDSRMLRNEEGVTELRLRWNTRDIMERDLKIGYTLQQLPLAPAWELHAPTLPKDEKVKTLFMCAQPKGMEFSGANLQVPVPVARLPRWVAQETQATEFGALSGAASGTLQSKMLPRLETAAGIVTRSEYLTRLVGDGSIITEATLDIEHQAPMRWTFALPEKSELLKCSLNGKPLQPIAREKGVMEIPLEATGGKEALTFSYTASQEKLDPLEGESTLALPLTPLFISEVLWTIELPDSYDATGVDGNLETAGGARAGAANRASLVKRLCRNERPQTQVFYKKRGIE